MANPSLWVAFILYVALIVYSILHHELWGDELHSWNIAKASGSFFELMSNTRYEGHPPVWYTILWLISKFTHKLEYVQWVHATIAITSVLLLLFFSPIPLISKLLIPFGYYFLYEYAVLSRNYAIGVLVAFAICLTLLKAFKGKLLVYYLLLLLLANTHLIALLLAISVHVYFLLLRIETKKNKPRLALHVVCGSLISISALTFIFPPTDSELNVHFWLNRWNVDQVKAVAQIPLRAFIPIPAWWNIHFWNTEFLLEVKNKFDGFKFVNLLITLLLFGVLVFNLRKSKKGLVLFFTNTLLTFITVMTLFPLGTARYSGFMFVGFVVAYWLSCTEQPGTPKSRVMLNMVLACQVIGGVFAVAQDARRPFSNAYRIEDLLNEVPKNERTVTDYWTLNIISAYMDRPFYCIDLEQERSFILWDKDLFEKRNTPNCYYRGVNNLFEQQKVGSLYLVTTAPPENLFKIDLKLMSLFSVTLADKREGAIEKGSNLYLYKISAR